MKSYLKDYWIRHRILKTGKKSRPKTPIDCSECSINFFRTNSRQKVCAACKPKSDYNRRLNWLRNKYKNDLDFRKRRQELTKKNVKIWVSRHKEQELLRRRISSNKRRAIGDLSKEIFQMVYEDNIKKYGTLTCMLCLKPIGFGEDSLEHKNPINRGGTNEYSNLGVSHLRCNMSKHTKTVEEYHEYIGLEK